VKPRDQVKIGPLALTLGDPAGIGPEIVVKAWSELKGSGPPFVVVGDFQALASAATGEAVELARVTAPDEALRAFPDALPVLDLPLRAPVVAGQPSTAAAPSVIQWIETARCVGTSPAWSLRRSPRPRSTRPVSSSRATPSSWASSPAPPGSRASAAR
jgi:hypothetical protein